MGRIEFSPFILNCLTTCRVVEIINTGTTTESLTFVDCSGNTITTSFEPKESALINYCSLFPFSGGTSSFTSEEKPGFPNAVYYLSGCCDENQFLTILANDDYLNLDDSVYSDEFIPSATSGETYNGCFYVYDKKSLKLGIGEDYYPIFKNPIRYNDLGCELCVEEHTCEIDCYELSACDGSVKTFTSANQNLSGYSNGSVLLIITDPLPIPEKCYNVKYIGKQTCEEEYSYIISEEGCSCSTPVTIEPRNECDVLTIFPMEVDCLITHPTTQFSFDGAATLAISGGTSPYEIVWNTGSIAPLIYNLNEGTYTATVTDYYGDFVVNTTCVLTAQTQTTTTTTTIKPLPVYGNLCMTIRYRVGGSKVEFVKTIQIQFETYNITNGQQSWLSDDGNYFLYWNTGSTPTQWTVSASTPSNGVIINNNSSTPPLIGWQPLGNPSILDISVISGDCGTYRELSANVTKNDYICETKGSINIQAAGGIPPYFYSINNGTTFSTLSVFSNLNVGSYTIIVKDSQNNQTTPQIITIDQVPSQTYSLSLTLDTLNKTFQIQASGLPNTDSITFTLAQNSILKYYPSSLPTPPTYDNVVTLNGGLGGMNLNSTTNNQNILSLNCSNAPVIENQQSIYYTKQLQISAGQIISGSYTDLINSIPTGPCEQATKVFKLFLLNDARPVNCKCCQVKVINPVQIAILKGNG